MTEFTSGSEHGGTSSTWIAGSCLCGAVRYEVDPGGAFDAGYCHCSMCRRSTGAPVLAWALVRRGALRITRGALVRYRSSDACLRCFCATCGGQLVYEVPSQPEFIGFHVATLDGTVPEALRPRLHMFADDQLPWLELRDDLPRYVDNHVPDPEKR